MQSSECTYMYVNCSGRRSALRVLIACRTRTFSAIWHKTRSIYNPYILRHSLEYTVKVNTSLCLHQNECLAQTLKWVVSCRRLVILPYCHLYTYSFCGITTAIPLPFYMFGSTCILHKMCNMYSLHINLYSLAISNLFLVESGDS